MRTFIFRCAFALSVLLLLAAATRTTHVAGRVIDSRDRPLEGIRIVAVRNGNIIAETRTTPEGKYDFVVAFDKPFDLLFRDGAYETLVTPDLPPGQEQLMTKRLSPRNDVLTAPAR